MDNLIFAFNALAPLILLGFVGYLIRARNLVGDDFIDHLNRFIYYIALPVLIFVTLANIDDIGVVNWGVIGFAVVMLLMVGLLGVIVPFFTDIKDTQKPVVTQAFFRGNFMLIGVPLAIRLGGIEALSVIIILNIFLIPLSNTMSIVLFSLWKSNGYLTVKKWFELMQTTMRNPLMIALFIGLIAFAFQPVWFQLSTTVPMIPDTLNLIAMTATPMAMIAIGGQFKFKRVSIFKRPLFVSVTGRLILVPFFVFSLAFLVSGWIDFTYAWAALIALFASPVAVSSVAVTKGLEGDDELASQIVIWSTALAIVSLFIIVVIFKFSGYL